MYIGSSRLVRRGAARSASGASAAARSTASLSLSARIRATSTISSARSSRVRCRHPYASFLASYSRYLEMQKNKGEKEEDFGHHRPSKELLDPSHFVFARGS